MTSPRWSVHPNALTAHLSEGSVVLHMDRKLYFQLNTTGAAIWRGLERGISEGEIAAELCGTYEVQEIVARQAVNRVIRELLDRELIAAVERRAPDGQVSGTSGSERVITSNSQ